MQILKSQLEKGVIVARLLIEYEEIVMAGGQSQAVQQAIIDLGRKLNVGDIHYASVTAMEETDAGNLELGIEAAVSPEVILGQYRGLEIEIGHNEDFEQAVLKAAARNIKAEIPELIIQRQLDNMENEAKAQLIESSTLHTLADIYSIVSRLSKQAGSVSEDELWVMAMKATESYVEKNVQDVDVMVEAIKGVYPMEDEMIFRAIVTRAQERSKIDAETIAKEVFEAYLRSQNETAAQWREARLGEADIRCRMELMLEAVIKEEKLEANEEEFLQEATALAAAYGMEAEQFISIVGDAGIKKQLCMQKAVRLIVDSAKGI